MNSEDLKVMKTKNKEIIQAEITAIENMITERRKQIQQLNSQIHSMKVVNASLKRDLNRMK